MKPTHMYAAFFGKGPATPLCEMKSASIVDAEERRSLEGRIAAIGPWFHNFEIARGVWTNATGAGPGPDYPARRWACVEPWFRELSGKDCLDVGCSSGFFSLKARESGAASALGIDSGEQTRAIEQARFAAEVLGLDVTFENVSVYDTPTLGRSFDVVLFMRFLPPAPSPSGAGGVEEGLPWHLDFSDDHNPERQADSGIGGSRGGRWAEFGGNASRPVSVCRFCGRRAGRRHHVLVRSEC